MKALIQISSLLLILCFSFLAKAQTDDEPTDKNYKRAPAYTAINQLRNGVLVVYLRTDHRKITTLKKLVKDHPKSKHYKKLLNRAVKEQIDLQESTIKAYALHYDFSNVLFMPDTCAKKLYAGTLHGIFVNDQLEFDEELSIGENEPFFVSFIGTPSTETSTGKKSLLIGDRTGKVLRSPFPYAVRMYSIGDILVSRSDAHVIDLVVKRQQRKLAKFYNKLLTKLAKGKLTDIVPKYDKDEKKIKLKKRRKPRKVDKNREHNKL